MRRHRSLPDAARRSGAQHEKFRIAVLILGEREQPHPIAHPLRSDNHARSVRKLRNLDVMRPLDTERFDPPVDEVSVPRRDHRHNVSGAGGSIDRVGRDSPPQVPVKRAAVPGTTSTMHETRATAEASFDRRITASTRNTTASTGAQATTVNVRSMKEWANIPMTPAVTIGNAPRTSQTRAEDPLTAHQGHGAEAYRDRDHDRDAVGEADGVGDRAHEPIE